ncbi:MAG: hypothetical protein ACK5MW_04895 [Enterococcus sp.]
MSEIKEIQESMALKAQATIWKIARSDEFTKEQKEQRIELLMEYLTEEVAEHTRACLKQVDRLNQKPQPKAEQLSFEWLQQKSKEAAFYEKKMKGANRR